MIVDGQPWSPENYDQRYRGPVTLRRALEDSLNVPMARLALETGLVRVAQTARKLGVESPLRPIPSLALGAFEMTPLEVARTYAVFASGGMLREPRATLAVREPGGDDLGGDPSFAKGAFPEDATDLVTSALIGAVVELRDVARVASDGAVFGRARRRPGTLKRGSVLIDASGSMGLTSEAIESLIQAVPGAVVAVYSARKGASARITVVARNGRMLSDLDRAIEGTGNCCDGPALLWLSRQMMPRIWVCDGQVTDSHDRPDPVLLDECRAIVEAAHITHVKVGPFASELPPVEETLRQLRHARLIK